jgi:hypothetical protein
MVGWTQVMPWTHIGDHSPCSVPLCTVGGRGMWRCRSPARQRLKQCGWRGTHGAAVPLAGRDGKESRATKRQQLDTRERQWPPWPNGRTLTRHANTQHAASGGKGLHSTFAFTRLHPPQHDWARASTRLGTRPMPSATRTQLQPLPQSTSLPRIMYRSAVRSCKSATPSGSAAGNMHMTHRCAYIRVHTSSPRLVLWRGGTLNPPLRGIRLPALCAHIVSSVQRLRRSPTVLRHGRVGRP